MSFDKVKHQFIDAEKPYAGTDVVTADVDGDGKVDVLCAGFWYKNPTWERFDIPGIHQVIQAYDIDGDGKAELIATTEENGKLSANLVWLKAEDPIAGQWNMHSIGVGVGDWPHGSYIGPLLPGGGLALVTAYHSVNAAVMGKRMDGARHFPEIWAVPNDSTQPWPKHTLAEIMYGEEMVAYDITGNGTLDLFAGPWWLENLGDGSFDSHRIVDDPAFYPARLVAMDVNGNGRTDIIMGQEELGSRDIGTPLSPLAWFECPEDPRTGSWVMHVIDEVRCAHSLGAGDLDGDGELELAVGEHSPFRPEQECRTMIYKREDAQGVSWKASVIDDRFEHHDGMKIFEVDDGQLGIVSHGWKDSAFVHLWTVD